MDEVRAARASECGELTAVALAAKRHWGYPEAWIALWRADLVYTPARLAREDVQVAEIAGRIAGVVSVGGAGEAADLEGMWVRPDAMGRGVGRRLWAAAQAAARARGAARLLIAADPHAAGFYLRLGARRIGEVPSRPAGRRLPLLEAEL